MGLVNDTLGIEVLIEHLELYTKARDAESECFGSCETSPGYYCHRYTKAKEIAASAFGKALTDFIDERIKAYFKEAPNAR